MVILIVLYSYYTSIWVSITHGESNIVGNIVNK